jgi:maltose alpha-D-glucosyltransferase/alpha-amylase
MQWSADRNAGFSRANPQRLYLPVNIDPEYHYEAINVEAQQNNPHSLLWWMKRMLAVRRQMRAFGRGSLEFLFPENRRILAFVRAYGDERVLVVANLSRFAQCVDLDLSKFQGLMPLEIFGRTDFPPITERPYFLSLGPHAFYWFALQPKEVVEDGLRIRTGEPPTVMVSSWDNVLSPAVRTILNPMLPWFLRGRRWFRSRNRVIRVAEIHDVVPFPKSRSYLALIRVEYREGDPEFYTLPVSVATGEVDQPDFVLARLRAPDGQTGILYSALRNRTFCDELLVAILRRRTFTGEAGALVASHTRQFRRIWGTDRPALEPTPARVDQDNTTLFYGDRFALKFLRKVEEGPHPENEIGAMLTQAGVPWVPPLAGALEYRNPEGEPVVLAILSGYVREGVEGWDYTQHHLGIFFEAAMAKNPTGPPPDVPPDEAERELITSYLEWVRQLGRRTGEMHAELAARPNDPVFAPEPFTDFYRHGLYHGMVGRVGRTVDQLRLHLDRLPEAVRGDARAVIDRQQAIRDQFRQLRDQRVVASRIRIHGDFHLGQVLYTGKDFVVIDFEGDPARPLSERRLKRSPLQDVAGMIDSFYHASRGVMYGEAQGVIPKPESIDALEAWARLWARRVALAYLDAYLATPGVAELLPRNQDQVRMLIRLFLLDLALRKLSFELAHEAGRVRVPCHLIVDLLEIR